MAPTLASTSGGRIDGPNAERAGVVSAQQAGCQARVRADELADEVIAALVESMRAAARIFVASGASRVHAPAAERFFIEKAEADRIDQGLLFAVKVAHCLNPFAAYLCHRSIWVGLQD